MVLIGVMFDSPAADIMDLRLQPRRSMRAYHHGDRIINFTHTVSFNRAITPTWGSCQSNFEFPGLAICDVGLRSRVALNSTRLRPRITNRVFPGSIPGKNLWHVGAARHNITPERPIAVAVLVVSENSKLIEGVKVISERLRPRRWFYIEHSDHRADGDVVAEQADAFDEFGVAEFLFHARE